MDSKITTGVLLLMAAQLVPACVSAPPSPTETPTTVVPTSTPAVRCTVVEAEPAAKPGNLVPPITDTDFSIGPADALATIVEYCDFQAPICQSMAAVIANVVENHREEVRFVFRPVPLVGQLDKTELAARAALAASRQEHFWEMYDLLFVRNDEWSELSVEDFEQWLLQAAPALGMERAQFQKDLASADVAAEAAELYARALDLGNLPLPYIVINGHPQPTYGSGLASIESAVSLITLARRQFHECPDAIIDHTKTYTATLHTAKGDIVIRLFAKEAPLAVNSFVFLVQEGWYDGVTFHRVIPGFMAQTGDPSGTGLGNPGYFFDNEDTQLKFDRPGMVGMANSGPDTNGSQFFITYAPAPHLDGGYTIFGEVLQGMDILEMLEPRDPETASAAGSGDVLESVEIEVD